MASRSAVASSWRSPAATAWASRATTCRSGLPEVMLGIHPGFGGTVRAVRLAGVRAAMQMMLTGKTLRDDQARRAGIVDRLVFPADAEAAARELIARQPKPRRAPLLDRVLSLAAGARPGPHGSSLRQVRAQGASRTLSGAVRHHRSVGRVRRARRARLRRRSAFHRAPDGGRDLAQPGARLPAAGSAEEPGWQGRSCRSSACTWSAPASWAATSPPGARSAGSTSPCRTASSSSSSLRSSVRAKAFDKRFKDPVKAGELMTRITRRRGRRRRAARRRDHRGHLRECRRQARAVRAARAAHEARTRSSPPILRRIMLEQLDDRPARSRPTGRHALLQPGGPDAAGRNRARRKQQRRRRCQRAIAFTRKHRQAAAALQERARISRESRAGAVSLRGHVRAAGWHPDRDHRRGRAALRHADGTRWSSPTWSGSMSASMSATS